MSPRGGAPRRAARRYNLSEIEEHGLPITLQMYVETIDAALGSRDALGDQRVAPIRRHVSQDRVGRGGGLVGEVDTGLRLSCHAPGIDGNDNVRRLWLATRTGHGSRLDGTERKPTVLLRPTTAEPTKHHVRQ